MRRAEIISAVRKLVDALQQSELLGGFRSLVERPAEGAKPGRLKLLKAIHRYLTLAHDFGPAEHELSKILGLDILVTPEVFASFSGAGEAPEASIDVGKLDFNLRFAAVHLPQILELLKPDFLRVTPPQEAVPRLAGQETSVLTVIVVEEGAQISSPARLVEALESITLMYEACAVIEHCPQEGLCVAACDSGSDKSFDFLGVAKVMESVRELILSLWDRVVFYREKQFAARVSLVAETLPIVERITQLEEQGRIGREQAEILRRKVVDGATKFMNSGVVIPEIEARSTYKPRALMAPEPKFLVGAIAGERPSDTSRRRKRARKKGESEP